jgi:hypothetical protein
MKKVYKLLVDGEIVNFESISIDDSGNPLRESAFERVFAYENNPTIVNISEMVMIPEVGSEYDSTINGFPFIGQAYPATENVLDFARFVLLIENTVRVKLFFDLSTEIGSRLNAVFLSNPTFLPPEITE